MRHLVAARLSAVLAALVVLSGCGGGPVDPEVQLQVIEETSFAASLGIDLASMTRLTSGVYVRDVVVGTGNTVVFGSDIRVVLKGWLANGTLWLDNEETLSLGNTPSIAGLEDAVFGMMVGGTRRAVIPPGRAYGALPRYDRAGNVLVPAGSIIVLEIELLTSVETP